MERGEADAGGAACAACAGDGGDWRIRKQGEGGRDDNGGNIEKREHLNDVYAYSLY